MGEPGAKRGTFLKFLPWPVPWPLCSLLFRLQYGGRGTSCRHPRLRHLHLTFLSLVSCEIDNQTAKPLTASIVLCPVLEEIL